MIRFVACFLFLFSSLSAKTIELYANWLQKDLSHLSKQDASPLLRGIWEEADKHQMNLVFKDLKEEQAELQKNNIYSIKGLKAWFSESSKKISSNAASCKILFDVEYNDLDFSRLPKEQLILFLWEPPTVRPHCYEKEFLENFSRVYTWDDSLVDNKKFFKFYYPELKKPILNYPSFKEKKLCTLISSRLSSNHPNQLYTEREKAIQFFERYPEDFDLYGRHWLKRNYQTYKGEIPDKIATMKNYRFSICYENTKEIPGYITEKIFDSFQAMCVPVYYGASNITQYIPKNCFIDRRDFSSYEELYAFLKGMTEEEYLSYLQAIQKFIESNEAEYFSPSHFVQTFSDALQYAEGISKK